MMETDASTQTELARKLLERMRLLQVARGRPLSFWRRRWESTGKVALMFLGLMLAAEAVPAEVVTHGWMLPAGVFLIVIGVSPRRDAPGERLDALIRFLDEKGQLSVPDVAAKNEEPA